MEVDRATLEQHRLLLVTVTLRAYVHVCVCVKYATADYNL
jgi:hypothetical protein